MKPIIALIVGLTAAWLLSGKNESKGATKEAKCPKQDGKPKLAFCTKEEAEKYANLKHMTKYGKQISYLCDECQKWHLCPEKYYTPRCNKCPSAEGKRKHLYPNYDVARRQADRQLVRQGVALRIYECPHSSGCYHLTKQI